MAKTYDNYKDSASQWVGIIPDQWEIGNFRYFGEFTKGKLPNSTNIEAKGNPIIGASEMLGKDCRMFTEDVDVPFCDIDDILILWDGANAGIVSGQHKGVVSSTAVKYHCSNPNVDTRYLFHYFKSLEPLFKEKVNGTTIPHMNIKYINEVPLLMPAHEEQSLIANFLDSKCSEIDSLISLQDEMIRELQAYKESVITETVTKGLDSNVKMKDSGVEWIGNIPESWKVIRIKRLLEERKERSEKGLEEPLSMSQKYGLIPTKEMDSIPNMASSFVGAKITNPGDLVFNKLKAHLGVFSVSKYFGLVSPDYAVYYPTNLADAKYLEYLFKTPIYISEFKKRSSGVGAGLTRLYTSDLFSIPAVCPSLETQKEISSFIDKKINEINHLISIKEKKIDALKNYKQSIIYEYVTGKKRV